MDPPPTPPGSLWPSPAQTSLLRRVITGVALLGVLVVAHLGLQKANGFVRGCTGFGDVAYSVSALGAAPSAEGSGCATVTEGAYASFAGVSNIAWGLLFYGLVVVLRLAYAATGNDRVRLASAGVVGVGLLYTAYLVYLQAAVIGAFCVLCMTSAALVLTLFVLHFVEQRQLRPAASADAPRRAAASGGGLRAYVPILGVFALLLAADVLMAGRVRASVPTPPAQPVQNIAAVAQQSRAAAAEPTDDGGACTYDPTVASIADLSPFTTGPYKGAADAPVTVVKVFDPNCPHCKSLSEALDPVIAEHGDEAKVYYVPFPLRQSSLAQVVALKVAAREGRFFELVDEMFARQDAQWGMSMPEITAAVEAAGMDGAAFQALLNDEAQVQPLLAQVQAESQAVQAAFAEPGGGLSVPKLAVDGRLVQSSYASYSPRCLAEFITEAAAGDAE